MSAEPGLPGPWWAVSVARVTGSDGETTGAGFLVAKDLVLTCAHVAVGGPGSKVRLVFPRAPGAPSVTGRVQAEGWSPPDAEDIAVVRLIETPAGLRPLPLGRSEGRRGHSVRSFGFPVGPEGEFGDAEAGDLLRTGLLQLSAANDVTVGFSGAPVWDEVAEVVIGMVSAVSRPDRLARRTGITYVTSSAALLSACPMAASEETCPYLGLEPFGEEHQRFFHGRTAAVRQLLEGLDGRPELRILLGPSGAGKSSLVRAGLLPALAEGGLPGSARWSTTVIRAGDDVPAGPGPEHELLVVDQFEATLTGEGAGAGIEALGARPGRTVLLVMRDDFYPRLAQQAPDLLALAGRLINVPATLAPAELHDIIEAPAKEVGLGIEPGLPERIIDDVRATQPQASAVVLPLLEVALRQLWEDRSDGRLTHAAYERLGRLSGSITTWCDRAIRGLPEAVVRDVLIAMVRPAEAARNVPAVRRPRTRDELRTLGGDGADDVLAALIDRRLVVARDLDGEPGAELAHDTLIRDWNRLQKWVEQDDGFYRWLERVEGRQQANELLGSRELTDGERWLDDRRLPANTAAFVTASRRAARRMVVVRRTFQAGLAVLTVVATVAATLAIVYARRADKQHVIALSRQLTAQSVSIDATRPATARRLAAAAWQGSPTTEAGAAMTTLLTGQQSVLAGGSAPVTTVAFSPDGVHLVSGSDDGTIRFWQAGTGRPAGPPVSAHTRAILALAYTPQGDALATASVDGTVRLWDTATGRAIGSPLAASSNRVNAVAFSADGTRLATGGGDGSVRLWDRRTGKPVGTPMRYPNRVEAVAFSLDGRWLATAAHSGTVELRDPRSGAVAFSLSNPDDDPAYRSAVRTLAFNQAGTRLATGDNDGGVGFWDLGTRRSKRVDTGEEPVLSVAYSPGGTRVASAGVDRTARLWDPAAGVALGAPITAHDATVWSVAFNGSGKVLATGGADGTVRLWDSSTGRATTAPLDTTGARRLAVTMTPTSSLIADTDDENTVQLREAASGRPYGVPLRGSADGVYWLAADRQHGIAATSGNEGLIRLWDVRTGREIVPPLPSAGTDMTFSADGTHLASADNDGRVFVWEIATGRQVREIRTGDDFLIADLEFSPDGTLMTAGSDTRIRFWNITTGALSGEIGADLREDPDVAAYTRNGDLLAVGDGSTVDLRDPKTGRSIRKMFDPGAEDITALAFNADGTVIASGHARTGGVRLWDAGTGRLIGSRPGHTKKIEGLALSEDNAFFVSVDEEFHTRAWFVPSPTVAHHEFCARFGGPTGDEWQRYAPGEPGPPKCGD
ncbi:trypsin-like peptidase domain-containing protein [Actinoplanes sp. LDG1-06]|uniref:Trypsin-like peptidase domain-containing protein n=1 Tax=Paractinoplanes ovalisporus TaxID=2810368 RepID=A0ABS2AL93_9ACTN|nr:trypsin-like peptidase domain-containing protein [Actinoplanes ovalisporus]MBM2620566.1 trypsin-like peptidase domain-containing protein [Actinoplanes ovalisporus]